MITPFRMMLYWLVGIGAGLQVIATAWYMHLVASIPSQPYVVTQEFLNLTQIVATLIVALALMLLAWKSSQLLRFLAVAGDLYR